MDNNAWQLLEGMVTPHLTPDDDILLWEIALDHIFRDAEYLCQYNPQSKYIRAEVARCSRWLSPHKKRWSADGGFAYPEGYGTYGSDLMGYPWHDYWTECIYWDEKEGHWSRQHTTQRKYYKQRQNITFTAIIPARTARHPQAAVFTQWQPGPPPLPYKELIQFYGFRRTQNGWQCTADAGPEQAYDLVAENV